MKKLWWRAVSIVGIYSVLMGEVSAADDASLKTSVDPDGTVHVSSLSIPYSSLASEEAR